MSPRSCRSRAIAPALIPFGTTSFTGRWSPGERARPGYDQALQAATASATSAPSTVEATITAARRWSRTLIAAARSCALVREPAAQDHGGRGAIDHLLAAAARE